jgi:hypothetical protein
MIRLPLATFTSVSSRFHPGQLGRELVGLLAFDDVDRRGGFPHYFTCKNRSTSKSERRMGSRPKPYDTSMDTFLEPPLGNGSPVRRFRSGINRADVCGSLDQGYGPSKRLKRYATTAFDNVKRNEHDRRERQKVIRGRTGSSARHRSVHGSKVVVKEQSRSVGLGAPPDEP